MITPSPFIGHTDTNFCDSRVMREAVAGEKPELFLQIARIVTVNNLYSTGRGGEERGKATRVGEGRTMCGPWASKSIFFADEIDKSVRMN